MTNPNKELSEQAREAIKRMDAARDNRSVPGAYHLTPKMSVMVEDYTTIRQELIELSRITSPPAAPSDAGEELDTHEKVCAYINKTPTLLSLLYDLNLLPEQHPDRGSEAWQRISTIVTHWHFERRMQRTHREAVTQPAIPEFILKRVRRSLEEAKHPKGMSTNDGKVRLDICDVERLIAAAPPVQPAQPAIPDGITELMLVWPGEHQRFELIAPMSKFENTVVCHIAAAPSQAIPVRGDSADIPCGGDSREGKDA
jgi:hypothetical protein